MVVEHAPGFLFSPSRVWVVALMAWTSRPRGSSSRRLLRKKEEEEEEKRKEEVMQRKRDELVALLDVPPEHRTPDQQSRVQALTREYRASKRKRKKRRKRRLPRTS